MGYNQGDTSYLYLEYTINDQPITEDMLDDIEVSIGNKQYTVSGGDIIWNANHVCESGFVGCYVLWLDQEDTFTFNQQTEYQVRFKHDGREVASTNVGKMKVGRSISRVVL